MTYYQLGFSLINLILQSKKHKYEDVSHAILANIDTL